MHDHSDEKVPVLKTVDDPVASFMSIQPAGPWKLMHRMAADRLRRQPFRLFDDAPDLGVRLILRVLGDVLADQPQVKAGAF